VICKKSWNVIPRPEKLLQSYERCMKYLENADCGMAAQYEDGTCSRIDYDPAKMSFRKPMEI
jgi:hypothetical protein